MFLAILEPPDKLPRGFGGGKCNNERVARFLSVEHRQAGEKLQEKVVEGE